MNASEIDKQLEILLNKPVTVDNLTSVQAELSTDIVTWTGILDWITINNHDIDIKNENNKEISNKEISNKEISNKEISNKEISNKETVQTNACIDNEKKLFLVILWIENLLRNPFNLQNTINSEQIESIKSFVLTAMKTRFTPEYQKYTSKCLALLVNHIQNKSNHKQNECYRKVSTDEYLIFNIPFSSLYFYSFITELSLISPVSRELILIEENDLILVKKYKIKIRSNTASAETVSDDIQFLVQMLNTSDSRLGWTVSKALYKISRFVEKSKLIEDLVASLSKPIFSDEYYWINTMCTLAFLVLEGNIINDITFINHVFRYENEFFAKSNILKETMLFLLWSISKSVKGAETIKSSVFHSLVYFSLFDCDFNCRRAAVCVIQEISGRLIDLDAYIQRITTESIRRRSDALKIFHELKDKEEYMQMAEQSLYSYDLETREIGAQIIGEYGKLENIKMQYKTLVEQDGIHRLIKYLFNKIEKIYNVDDAIDQVNNTNLKENGTLDKMSNNKKVNELYSLNNEKIKSKFVPYIENFKITLQNYKYKNMNTASFSYLRIIKYFPEIQNIQENVIFLANKGFIPNELNENTTFLFSDKIFSDKVFGLINKNKSYLLLNANNKTHREDVIKHYCKNLKECKYIENSIFGLQIAKAIEKDIQLVVKTYLEDYSISYYGDIGYYNRKAAMMYFCAINGTDSIISVTSYFIRFLADKSKFLRDDVLKALLQSHFDEYKHLFPLNNKNAFIITASLDLKIFKNFFDTFDKMITLKLTDTHTPFDYDEVYFSALFKCFSTNEDFQYGIQNTFKTADGKLVKTLLKIGFKSKQNNVLIH